MQNETGLACETNCGERGCGDREETFVGMETDREETFVGMETDREETFHQILRTLKKSLGRPAPPRSQR